MSVRPYDARSGGTFSIRVIDTDEGGNNPTVNNVPAPSCPLGNSAPTSARVISNQANVQLPASNDFAQLPRVPAFQAQAGRSYRIETYDLSHGVDTIIELRRAADGGQPSASDQVVARNDDISCGNLASTIEWVAPGDGSYYVSVGPYSPQTGGTFSIRVVEEPSN